MRLLLILPSFHRGGNEEHALTIARAAVQRGWEVHAAFPRSGGTDALAADFHSSGVRCHALSSLQDALIARGSFLRTLVLLQRITPDVVQINLPWPDWLLGCQLACALRGVPTAVVFQLVPPHVNITQQRRKLYRWALSRKQRWVAVSENNRSLLSEKFGVPGGSLDLIYNGTRLGPPLAPDEARRIRAHVRAELRVPDSARILLTVASLTPQKGHELYVQAIPHIAQDFPDVRFVWIGDGDLRGHLQEKLKDYGVAEKVHLLPYRNDVMQWMHAADLFVFPTWYEGHPFVLLEAMSAGLPVVSSAASGIPELITSNEHGLLFRTGDSCALLETLRWALRHEEAMRGMAANARKRVQDFSVERMMDETLAALTTLAQSRKGNSLS